MINGLLIRKFKIFNFNLTFFNFQNYYYSFTNNNIINHKKPIIIIISRLQPSHNCSSFICEGILKNLINLNKNEYLLNNFEIVVIPFFSLESTYFGNTRNNLNKENLSNWMNNSFNNADEVKSIKELIIQLKKKSKILLILELHDNDFNYNYYFKIYNKELKDKKNIKEYRNLLNIIEYVMNFINKKKNKFINKHQNTLKKMNIDYLLKFYVSTYGNDNNKFNFNPNDYKKIGENLLFCLNLFLINKYNNLNQSEYLKEMYKEIHSYYSNNLNQLKLDLNLNDSLGSNSNYYINIQNDLNIENQKIIEKKNTIDNNYIINHERNEKTKNYDYIIKLGKNSNFQIKKNIFKKKKLKTEEINLKSKFFKTKIINLNKNENIQEMLANNNINNKFNLIKKYINTNNNSKEKEKLENKLNKSYEYKKKEKFKIKNNINKLLLHDKKVKKVCNNDNNITYQNISKHIEKMENYENSYRNMRKIKRLNTSYNKRNNLKIVNFN